MAGAWKIDDKINNINRILNKVDLLEEKNNKLFRDVLLYSDGVEYGEISLLEKELTKLEKSLGDDPLLGYEVECMMEKKFKDSWSWLTGLDSLKIYDDYYDILFDIIECSGNEVRNFCDNFILDYPDIVSAIVDKYLYNTENWFEMSDGKICFID